MKSRTRTKKAYGISGYIGRQAGENARICRILRKEIDSVLTGAESSIYYAIPVWFIGGNPIVGFSASKGHVTLLFWSGRAFKTEGLEPEGSFKAAQAKFTEASAIDKKTLRRWLKESKKYIYNYRDIRTNRGKLTLVGPGTRPKRKTKTR